MTETPSLPLDEAAAQELLTIARTVALEGMEIASARRRDGVAVAATKSSAVDVVTAADREVEQHIRARLRELRPQDGFYGEESDPAVSETGLNWIVDPIDGTVNYLYGFPNFGVSIAVVHGDPRDEPSTYDAIAGAVVTGLGEVFTAVRDGGAFVGTERLQLDEAPALGEALVATGFSYDAERRRQQAEVWMHLAPLTRDLRRMGAAALDLCAIARGQLDVYFESGIKPWDYAAGALIAREAGAVVRGVDGGREGRALLTAMHPGLVEEFDAAFRSAQDRTRG